MWEGCYFQMLVREACGLLKHSGIKASLFLTDFHTGKSSAAFSTEEDFLPDTSASPGPVRRSNMTSGFIIFIFITLIKLLMQIYSSLLPLSFLLTLFMNSLI